MDAGLFDSELAVSPLSFSCAALTEFVPTQNGGPSKYL